MTKYAKYSVYKFWPKAERWPFASGLTKEEAQRICEDPEKSGSTAKTKKYGEPGGLWFYGWTKV